LTFTHISVPINAYGQVEWTPPPELDTGATRVNDYHHPERMLHRNDNEPEDEHDAEDERPTTATANPATAS
jgi:hypothetical protein